MMSENAGSLKCLFRTYSYYEFSGTVKGITAKIGYFGLEKCLGNEKKKKMKMRNAWDVYFPNHPLYVQFSLTTDCLVIFLLGSFWD